MGMDLMPLRPTSAAPRDDRGRPEWGRYNISGWIWLKEHLRLWGLDTTKIPSLNDGHVIPAYVCEQIGQLYATHLMELPEDERAWAQKDMIFWLTCGGCRVY